MMLALAAQSTIVNNRLICGNPAACNLLRDNTKYIIQILDEYKIPTRNIGAWCTYEQSCGWKCGVCGNIEANLI